MILQTHGDYVCYNATISGTITNQPNSSYGAFKLTVEQISNVERYTQRLIYNANQYLEFERSFTGSWSPWQRIKVDEKAQCTFTTNKTISSTSYEHMAFDNILTNTDIFELNSDGDLVCKKSGDYLINANICIGGSALVANDRLILSIMRNGNKVFSQQQDTTGTQQSIVISGYMVHLSVNDKIVIQYRNLTGARGTVIATQSFMSITS